MTREDIIFNIKSRIMALKSLSPKEQEANKDNLWELEDLLAMIENDHIEDKPQGLDEAKKKHIDDIAEDHSKAYERINREMDERQKWRDGHPKEYAKQLDDAVKEYERLDEAAEEYAENDAYGEPDRVFTAALMGFKAGAKWGEKDTIERAVKWWERNLRYLIATANVRDTYLTDFKRDMEEGL